MLTTSLTKIESSVSALAKIDVTQEVIDQYWRGPVLRKAVEYLIKTTCFGRWVDAEMLLNLMTGVVTEVPDRLRAQLGAHASCFEFWQSLPADEQWTSFYCLGAPFTCTVCGSVVQANIGIDDHGKLVKGACPHCGEPVESLGLEKHHWWEALTSTAGDHVGSFANAAGQLTGGLILKLADILVSTGVIVFDPESIKGRSVARSEIYLWLKDKFPDWSGGYCHDAATWTIWGELGFKALGLQNGKTLLPSQRRRLSHMAELAGVKALRGDDLDAIKPAAEQIWKDENLHTIGKARALTALLTDGEVREPVPDRLPAFEIINPDRPDEPGYMVVKGTHVDLLRLRELTTMVDMDDEDIEWFYTEDGELAAPPIHIISQWFEDGT